MPFPNADHIAAQNGAFEPQLSNRFLMEIYGLASGDLDVIVLALNNLTPPVISVEPTTIPFGNEERKVAGRATFDDITLNLKDFVDAPVRDAMHRWFEQVYDPNTGLMGYARDYKKEGSIIMTGPDGESQRVYNLIGIFPTSLNPGSFDMGGAENIEIDMSISIDKMIYVPSA